MRYWVLELILGILHPDPPTRERDKFGGLPWGLPSDRWPGDAKGGYPFFAQIAHAPERADLGRAGRTAYLFMGGEETFGTVVFVESAEDTSTPTPVPDR